VVSGLDAAAFCIGRRREKAAAVLRDSACIGISHSFVGAILEAALCGISDACDCSGLHAADSDAVCRAVGALAHDGRHYDCDFTVCCDADFSCMDSGRRTGHALFGQDLYSISDAFCAGCVVNRRSVRESEVPPEIRRGNLLLAVGIILLLMGIVLCRAPFLHLLGWLREVTVLLAAMLLRGFSRLIAMLGGNAPEAEADQAQPTGEPQIPETAAGNPFWLLIWVPVILIAIYIWRVFLSEWVYDIREAISLLIQRLRSSRQQETGRLLAQNAAYTDTETREKPRPSAGRLRRNWKKKLRAWHKMPGSCEKFYAGYLLLLEAPAWRENLPHDADTVQEIRGQWQRLYGTELDAVTDDFEVHRYAEKPLPEDALSAMAAALERAAIR